VDMLQDGPGIVIGAHGRDSSRLSSGPDVHQIIRDIQSEQDASWVVEAFVEAAGGIDGIVVLSGGLSEPTHWQDMGADSWRQDIDVNLSQQFFLARAALTHMADGGRVIMNGTESSLHGGGSTSLAYGVAKHGVECLVKGLAREVAPRAITVNGVRLGYIDSGFHGRWQNQSEQQQSNRVAKIPLRRAGTVDEAAALIVYLLSEYGAFITGQMISLAGGDWL